jgi:regulatory protein
MRHDDGGEHEALAPVIPLFGGPVPTAPRPTRTRPASGDVDVASGDVDRALSDAGAHGEGDVAAELDDVVSVDSSSDDSLTDVAAGGVAEAWHPTWADDRPQLGPSVDSEHAENLELAEKVLLKKLRTRSLSVSEARGVLREYSLDAAEVDHLIAQMDEYGYLDDAALADQLIHAGADRKCQGRQAIAQTLAKRGIPREVADVALAELPDDDLERALEFARSKARSLQSLDRDTALRRLTGQLARRGYGSLAMTAARIALDEGSRGSGGGVRFV